MKYRTVRRELLMERGYYPQMHGQYLGQARQITLGLIHEFFDWWKSNCELAGTTIRRGLVRPVVYKTTKAKSIYETWGDYYPFLQSATKAQLPKALREAMPSIMDWEREFGKSLEEMLLVHSGRHEYVPVSAQEIAGAPVYSIPVDIAFCVPHPVDMPPDLKAMYASSQVALRHAFEPECRGFIVYGGIAWWCTLVEWWDKAGLKTFWFEYLEPPYVMGMTNAWYEEVRAEYEL